MARKGTLTVRVLGDTKPFEKAMSGIGRTVGNVGKIVASGGLAIAGATAAIGVGAVKAFADFDAAMTQSTAIMGDVSDAMRDDMSKAARAVAKSTKFSATQAAESYFFLASAGLDAQQSIEALPQVAAFAQAGMFDMALATDLATDAQSALGLKAEDAQENLENLTRVTDVLVKANTLANASVEQFATALTQKAGGALRNVGKDIEEGAAVLSVFADQGIKAERAGTILRSTLDDLSKQSRKNAEAFEKHGVAVFDANGDMRNMADIVGDLEGGLQGMSTEQREATLAQLGFNQRSREGILALVDNSEALRDYEGDLRNAAGTTQEVADKQLQTFWAKLGIVKDQLIDVAISVGQTLMPALEAMADWLSSELPAVTGWFDRVSTKFMDLLGTGEESTEGITVALSDMESDIAEKMTKSQTHFDALMGTAATTASGVDTSTDDIRESLAGMESDIAVKMRQSQQHLEALAGTSVTTAEDMETPFEKMGGMFSEMHDAWLKVWQEDIQPWIVTDFLPWFERVVPPALARVGSNAGSAFVSWFVAALKNDAANLLPVTVETIVNSLNDALEDVFLGGAFGAPLIDIPTLNLGRFNFDPPTSAPLDPRRRATPGGIQTFHGGGVASAGLGLLADKERVLSPQQTSAFDRLVSVLERGGGAGGIVIQAGASLIGEVKSFDDRFSLRQIEDDLALAHPV